MSGAAVKSDCVAFFYLSTKIADKVFKGRVAERYCVAAVINQRNS